MEEMNCKYCGAALQPGDRFCAYCGRPVEQEVANTQEMVGNWVQEPETEPVDVVRVLDMSKEAYRTVCKNKKYLNQIKTAAIICYICAGINLVLAFAGGSILPLIDVAISVPLAILLQTKKSKGVAIALLVYGVFVVLINLVLNGQIAGWLWLVAGIGAVTAFNLCDKEYEEIKRSQQL
jgi:hypothetical protein